MLEKQNMIKDFKNIRNLRDANGFQIQKFLFILGLIK